MIQGLFLLFLLPLTFTGILGFKILPNDDLQWAYLSATVPPCFNITWLKSFVYKHLLFLPDASLPTLNLSLKRFSPLALQTIDLLV